MHIPQTGTKVIIFYMFPAHLITQKSFKYVALQEGSKKLVFPTNYQ